MYVSYLCPASKSLRIGSAFASDIQDHSRNFMSSLTVRFESTIYTPSQYSDLTFLPISPVASLSPFLLISIHALRHHPHCSCHIFWMMGRKWNTRFFAYAFYFLIHSASTETVQQLLWNVPSGSALDSSLTFTNDQTIPLSWNAASDSQYFDTPVTNVYLWCTSFDWNLNQYASLLKRKHD